MSVLFVTPIFTENSQPTVKRNKKKKSLSGICAVSVKSQKAQLFPSQWLSHVCSLLPLPPTHFSNNMDSFTLFLIVLVSFLALVLFSLLIIRLFRLVMVLQYVNMEIGRCKDEEKLYWLSEKKRIIRDFFLPFL